MALNNIIPILKEVSPKTKGKYSRIAGKMLQQGIPVDQLPQQQDIFKKPKLINVKTKKETP